ncbi:MAG: class I SAM-dependent methyltransferase [Methylococcaceae bacterium]|jgi:SAM-dependent methyltransferase
MIKNADTLRKLLRYWFRPLRTTPLHPQWLVSLLGKKRGAWISQRAKGQVLDVGCADCSIHLLLTCESYIGIDFPTTANNLYGTKPNVFANASHLPFVDSCFDSVLMLDVLEHLAEPELALHEAFRSLRSGGILLLTIPFAYPLHDQPYDYQRYTEHGIAQRLKQAGFCKIIVEEQGLAIQAATSLLVLTLTQACIEAIAQKSWRVFFVPLIVLSLPFINVFGWLISTLYPVHHLMPSAYYVQAQRG